MKDTNYKPLLTAPAGSMEALYAALEAGADEVYLGSAGFNARKRAKNFSEAELLRASKLCGSKNARILYTLNTLVTDREIPLLLEHADFVLSQVKPYAFIVQDIGLASALRTRFPDINLHASTQMQIHSSAAASLLARRGVTRVVLAREMSLEEIKSFVSCGLESEIFIHGALCVSVSGGCLFSSFVGKRSGNRGECAQPCRLPYGGAYPLSLKDLCLAEHIPAIIDAGITSLKIEGRMKSADYVYTVTSVYRRLIDEKRAAARDEMELLRSAFSRSGFTDGYFTGIKTDMLGIRTQDEKNFKAEKALQGQSYVRNAKNAEHPVIQTAAVKHIKTSHPIIPPKEQNGFASEILDATDIYEKIKLADTYSARIDIPLCCFADREASERYVNLIGSEKICAVLPRTITDRETETVKRLLENARIAGITRVLVHNLAFLQLCDGLTLHGGIFLNITNTQTAKAYTEEGFSSLAISPEADPSFLTPVHSALEYIVYGFLPLMYTEQSLPPALVDRTNASFPVIQDSSGRSIVCNSFPLWLAESGYKKKLRSSGVGIRKLLFTGEDIPRMKHVLERFRASEPPDCSFTRGYLSK